MKFKFIIDNSKLSRPYTIEEIKDKSEEDILEEDILEEMEVCTCQFNESNNHCECEPRYEDSNITGRVILVNVIGGVELYEGDVFEVGNTTVECKQDGYLVKDFIWDDVVVKSNVYENFIKMG